MLCLLLCSFYPLALLALGGTAAASVLPRPLKASFGTDGSPQTAFGKPSGVAIDQQRHFVYVADVEADALYRFGAAHQPVDFSALGSNQITGLSLVDGAGESQAAVDSATGIIYITNGYGALAAFKENGEPADFTAGSGSGTNEISGFGELLGVSVDGAGDIYAADYQTGVSVYSPAGELITEVANTAQAGNLAVDSQGTLYVNYWHSGVEKLMPNSYPIAPSTTYSSGGMVDTAEAYSVAVDRSTNSLYVDEGDRIAQYDSTAVLVHPYIAESGDGAVTSSQGLAVDGDSGDLYVSDTGGTDRVEIFGPPPPPVPVVESEAVSDISMVDARLKATINPDGLQTTYQFEYGPTSAYGQTVPVAPATVGEGEQGIVVQQPITGLAPGTVYHFTVVATNSAGTTVGEDRLFTTDAISGVAPLPDGRAYEMVSPPDKNGVNILNNSGVEASLDGNAASFSSLGGFGDAKSAGVNNWYRAQRANGEWLTRGISPPYAPNGEQLSTGLMALTQDLGRMVMTAHPAPPTVPGEQIHAVDFLRRDIPDGSFENLTPNVPNPNTFAESRFAGADAALDAVGINSEQQLTVDAPPASEQKQRAYVWANGTLHFVGVLPDGSTADISSIGYRQCCQENRNAISQDGHQVVFWAAGLSGGAGVYLRENPAQPQSPLDGEGHCTIATDACTIKASASQRTPAGPENEAQFQGATVDGSRVFFKTEDQLVNSDTDSGPVGNDLYLFEPQDSRLRRVSDDQNSEDGVAAQFENVLTISDDGRYVYFAAVGMLVPGQPTTPGMNIYVWHDDGTASGSIRYIATLLPSLDGLDWSGALISSKRQRTQASPSGRYFTFSAATPLASYDNFNPQACHVQLGSREEGRCYELYRYDWLTTTLTCISCDPTGETATGDAALYGLNESGINGIGSGGTGFTSHNVLDDGRVFFETKDSLGIRDTNGSTDVYEWSNRVAALLSTGQSEDDSHFANATPSGDDVFFLTSDRLVGIDIDSNVDLYDARVNGGLASQNPSIASACQAEECRNPLAEVPPVPLTASTVFSGSSRQGRHHKKRHHKKRHHSRRHRGKRHRHPQHQRQHARAGFLSGVSR